MEFLKAAWQSFYGSFFLSIESTLVGIALGFGDWLFAYLGTIQLPTWAHVLVGVASYAFIAYKQDRAKKAMIASGAVAISAAPRGFGRIGLLVALAVALGACAWFTRNAPTIQDVAAVELAKCGPGALVAYTDSKACFARPSFETCMGAITVDLRVVQCAVDTYISERERLQSSQEQTASLTSDVQPGDVPLARAKAWRAAHP